MEKFIEEFENHVCLVRGLVIQKCTELEWAMEVYISEYFSNDNKRIIELATLVLAPRVSWYDKLDILKTIFELNKVQMNAKMKNYYSDIKSIIEDRNVFAHFPIDQTASALQEFNSKKALRFLKFKNSKENTLKKLQLVNYKSYTPKQLGIIIDKLEIYAEEIKKMTVLFNT